MLTKVRHQISQLQQEIMLINSNKTSSVDDLYRLMNAYQDISGIRYIPHKRQHLTHIILIKAHP